MPQNAEAFRLLTPLPDPILVLDKGQRLVFANPAARGLFPILENVRFGLLLSQIVNEAEVLRAVDRVLNGATQSANPVIVTLPTPAPHRFRITAAKADMDGGSGTPACILVLHDETTAWRAEEMRADFIANASHELRTPLASVMGYVETLQGPAKNDEQAREKFLDIMAEQCRRMTRLIDDLLSLSRIEQEEHRTPDTPIPLGTVLDSAVNVLAHIIDENGIDLKVDAPDDVRRAVILADKDLLVQVFQNLLENAVKYGGEGKKIILSGQLMGNGVAVNVQDFGAGIAPENLNRLTERFFRVDKKISRNQGGTGLGLAIVKHIVGQHRGQLSVESELGKGSTFTVTLPLAHNPAGQ